jgi:beta-mannosidase
MRQIGFIIIFFLPQFLWSQPVIEKEITDWEFRMVGDSVWKKAVVPGTIIDNFADLSDISNPLHPYYGGNEKLYQWIGEKDWEFRTSIYIGENKSNGYNSFDLILNGLDLFADITINGRTYGNSNNAFTPIIVHDVVSEDNLNIHILFRSTITMLNRLAKENKLQLPGGNRVYVRKPQYEFGWDWGPSFINIGIRKPVIIKIISTKYTRIAPLNIRTKNLDKKNSQLIFDIGAETEFDSVDVHYTIFTNGVKYRTSIHKFQKGITSFRLCSISPVRLWWPNGMGKKSNYYEFDIKVTLPGDTTTLAHEHIYYAACNIKLVQEKNQIGESFYFTVNGEKVFAKGANYVPDDSFHPGKNTSELVQLAKDGNMNMIRVWGGGSYPDDEFYIECMKNGIMIWQDFMFACAMYPGDQNFLDNITSEADFQVKRLKYYNHIAVWCGNNENEEGWKNWGWQKDLKIHGEDSIKVWNNYDTLFNKILPQAIKTVNQRYESHFNYISTSPKHGWGRKESMIDGDAHYWGVWWGLEPISTYNEKVPRFMSEFGMQSMPNMETLKKVIPDSAMNFNSPKFKNHQKHPTGFQTLDHYLKEYLVIPDSLNDYAYATQILQAYALTIAIEAQRRAMPYCMGSLIWQLNDCWPVTSWSLVDSELKKKIAYYEVKQVFKPLHISVKEEKETYEIYVTNDGAKTPELDFVIYIKNFYGEVIWTKKACSHINENSSNSYVSIPKSSLTGIDLTTIYMYTYIQESEKIKNKTYLFHDENYFHFVRPNQLKLPVPEFKIITDSYGTVLKTNVYCPYIMLPSFLKNEGAYLGTVQAGTRNISSYGNVEYLQWLSTNTSKIKCLNTLLDHPR